MANEQTPNPGLPMGFFEKKHIDSSQKPCSEQKIPGKHKIRKIR